MSSTSERIPRPIAIAPRWFGASATARGESRYGGVWRMTWRSRGGKHHAGPLRGGIGSCGRDGLVKAWPAKVGDGRFRRSTRASGPQCESVRDSMGDQVIKKLWSTKVTDAGVAATRTLRERHALDWSAELGPPHRELMLGPKRVNDIRAACRNQRQRADPAAEGWRRRASSSASGLRNASARSTSDAGATRPTDLRRSAAGRAFASTIELQISAVSLRCRSPMRAGRARVSKLGRFGGRREFPSACEGKKKGGQGGGAERLFSPARRRRSPRR